MSECTGAEIFEELCGHLKFPTLLPGAIIRPAMLPYITSQFLTRATGDRPPVLSADRPNLAFLGQYVEIPEDTVFTVEYSVRAGESDLLLFCTSYRNPARSANGRLWTDGARQEAAANLQGRT